MCIPDKSPLPRRLFWRLLPGILLLCTNFPTRAEGEWTCQQPSEGVWECVGQAPVTPAPADTTTPPAVPVPETAPTRAAPAAAAPVTATAPTPPAPALQAVATPDAPAAAAVSGQAPATDPWSQCPPVGQATFTPATGDARKINMQADTAHSRDNNIFTLQGNAVVRKDQQQLAADTIVYTQDAGRLDASGGIHFATPDLVVESASATLYPGDATGQLREVDYTLPTQHVRGHAAALELQGPGRQELKQVTYTTCPPGNTDWQLSAKRVDIDQAEGTGTARQAKLAFKGVPILYSPYLSFPLDDRRKSGLLPPTYGASDETGTDITVPWYWNIAPDRDATIAPRVMSDRGVMLGAEFRYLNKRSQGVLRGEYLPSDDGAADEDRSLVSIQHNGRPLPRLSYSIIASNVSDDRYFEELGTSLVQTSQTNLERTGRVNYRGDGWDLGLMVRDYQRVDPLNAAAQKPYKQLPAITFNANPGKRPYGLKFTAHAELDNFKNSDDTLVKGTRFDVQPRLSYPVSRAAWYVEPAVSVRHTLYDLDNVTAGSRDNPDRTTPVASLDAGTFFERISRWGDTGFVQTLEPRLYYLYIPDKDQDDLPVFDTSDYDFNFWTLFRENRFTGPDRMGDANQLALALTTRFLDPASGTERFRASLGSLLYFRDREVTLPGSVVETEDSSALIAELDLALSRYWRADAEVQWDPHDSQTDRNHYRLQYRVGPRQLVNLSYRQRRGIEEQVDFSFLWPLTPRWHAVGRWYYSLPTREIIEAIAGIGYESCCWGAQLVGRTYIKNDQQERIDEIFLQLELKGLGKLGSKIDAALERGILGY